MITPAPMPYKIFFCLFLLMCVMQSVFSKLCYELRVCSQTNKLNHFLSQLLLLGYSWELFQEYPNLYCIKFSFELVFSDLEKCAFYLNISRHAILNCFLTELCRIVYLPSLRSLRLWSRVSLHRHTVNRCVNAIYVPSISHADGTVLSPWGA